jgi:DNA-binding transcriptional MocR family regulator
MNKKESLLRTTVALIKSGVLNVGDKLPSLRIVSADKGVSLSTALNAYSELVSFGIIESRPKNGYFILTDDEKLLDYTMKKLSVVELPEMTRAKNSAEEQRNILYIKNSSKAFSGDCIQLASDRLHSDYFDDGVLNKQLYKKMRLTVARSNWPNTDAIPAPELLISKWMLPLSCIFRRDNMILTSCAAEALALTIRSCASSYGTIGIESPGHMRFFLTARYLNLSYTEIRCDPVSGLCIDDLSEKIEGGIKFSCLLHTAHFSDPTGALMPDANKNRLVELCARHEIPIIEYDDQGRFAFSQLPPNPLKSIDHENVIYISGFGGILGESLDLGWIEGGKYADLISHSKWLIGLKDRTALTSCMLSNMTLEMLDLHIAGLCRSMKASVALFRSTLMSALPECVRVSEAKGGPYLWLELPDHCSADEFSADASLDNVFIAPGRLFSSFEKADTCLRVNCCAVKDPNLVSLAAERLSRSVNCYLAKKGVRSRL